VPYNNGEVAMFAGLAAASNSLTPDKKDVTGVIASPPVDAGGVAHSFSGGSSIGISANSQHPGLAKDALKLIFSKTFQTKMAADSGWIPGNTSYSSALPKSMASAQLQGEIAKQSKLTPAAENWAIVEGDNVTADFYAELAKGADIDQTAKATDAKIEDILNKK
jgi:N,N'-diacetylchitobiose transport system substrate-binding protein